MQPKTAFSGLAKASTASFAVLPGKHLLGTPVWPNQIDAAENPVYSRIVVTELITVETAQEFFTAYAKIMVGGVVERSQQILRCCFRYFASGFQNHR